MSVPSPVTWTYGDWRRQATDELKRDRLILHIEEVEGFIVKAEGRGGRKLELEQGRLAKLEQHLERLEAKIDAKSQKYFPRKSRSNFQDGLIVVLACLASLFCKNVQNSRANQISRTADSAFVAKLNVQ